MSKLKKKDILAKCREILKDRGELEGENYDLALSLFLVRRANPNPSTRLRIKVDRHPLYKLNCFFFYDGEKWQDFSYLKSLDNPALLPRRERVQAFRNEIYPQIADFREKAFKKHENQRLLELYESDCAAVHVDHVYPFSALLDEFLSKEGILLDGLDIYEHSTSFCLLKDRNVAKRWQSYHKEKAAMQLLPARENIQKSNSLQIAS